MSFPPFEARGLRTPAPTLEPDDLFLGRLSALAVAGAAERTTSVPSRASIPVMLAAACVAVLAVGIAWLSGLGGAGSPHPSQQITPAATASPAPTFEPTPTRRPTTPDRAPEPAVGAQPTPPVQESEAARAPSRKTESTSNLAKPDREHQGRPDRSHGDRRDHRSDDRDDRGRSRRDDHRPDRDDRGRPGGRGHDHDHDHDHEQGGPGRS